jgi:hypothetical protein
VLKAFPRKKPFAKFFNQYNLPARLKLALRYLAISQHFLQQSGSGRKRHWFLRLLVTIPMAGMPSLFKTAAASRPGTANFFSWSVLKIPQRPKRLGPSNCAPASWTAAVFE